MANPNRQRGNAVYTKLFASVNATTGTTITLSIPVLEYAIVLLSGTAVVKHTGQTITHNGTDYASDEITFKDGDTWFRFDRAAYAGESLGNWKANAGTVDIAVIATVAL